MAYWFLNKQTYNGKTLITVGVCDACGDDTLSSYEVMDIR